MIRRGVYFARDPQTGRIKVGLTSNVDQRMAALRREVRGLELLVLTPGCRRIEAGFHALLIDQHIAHEWFHPSPRLDAIVIGLREGWFDFAKLPKGASPLRSRAAALGHETRKLRLAA